MPQIPDFLRNTEFPASTSAAAARAALGLLTSGNTTGSIFYVDSTTGTSGGSGSLSSPTATIKQAMALCTASKGDIILCFPGHAETIVNATDLAMGKAGVSIIGLGQGADRPLITYGTSTSANIPITAASCRLANVVLLNNIDSATAAVTISAADVMLDGVEIRDQTDKEFVVGVLTTSAADRLTIRNCFHNGYTGGDACTEAFSLIGVDVGLIENCRFLGNYSTACINMLTTACTKMVIKDCTFLETGDVTLAKLVKDTQGSSTWCLTDSFDLPSGRKVYGSSGQSVQPDDGNWRFVTATSTSPLTATTLWTYTGSIEAIIIGRVATQIQGQATTVKLQVTSDALSAADLCATKDINGFLVGSLLTIPGAVASAMLATTGVANAVGQITPSCMTCVTSGIIKPVFGAASTGAIVWEMKWRPISRGASVV